jgi:hypothetical protein
MANAESYPISAIFAGDILCPIGSTTVTVQGIQTISVTTEPPADGAVLTFVEANNDLEWLPDTDIFNPGNTYFVSLVAGDILVYDGAYWTNSPLPPFLATHASPLSTDPGTPGEIAYDTGYIYVCQASGHWGRALLTFGY